MPGRYEFESLEEILNPAEETNTEVILDILHFGWPDHIDVFSEDFGNQFERFTFQLARFIKQRRYSCRIFAPVNEISFLAWGGGQEARINPFVADRGGELKRNLIRAAVASSEVLLNEVPNARLISPEPVIHIVGDPLVAGSDIEAALHTQAQFEAWDMLSGRTASELGGRPEYLDIVGVNFYARNEWVVNTAALPLSDPRYRPFHNILGEIWQRYHRPMFVSETGTEDCERAEWLNYICSEVFAARKEHIPVSGICLYPILNHPGWDDDRHCHNGLFDYADVAGHRQIHWPLANALLMQQQKFAAFKDFAHEMEEHGSNLFLSSAVGIRFPTPSTSDEPLRPYTKSIFL